MNFFVRRPWDLPHKLHTLESVYDDRSLHRREFLTQMGIIGIGTTVAVAVPGCQRATKKELADAGAVSLTKVPKGIYPAKRDVRFEYGREESEEQSTQEFTNFYEFSTRKTSWKFVGDFQPDPWSVEITGLCKKPVRMDMDDFYRCRDLKFESRDYRHRCVETWAMCLPWTGFALRDLLKYVEPLPSARFVRFETFNRPHEAPNMGNSILPWPYVEGLTLSEAMNELAFVATGCYGHPLPKQNGAPIRIVLPWKYGFKSIKSIVKIELMDEQPETFWNTVNPEEYGFEANVNPAVPHPRWSQRTEKMLGTGEVHATVIYNGYGKWVESLYRS